jgi:S-adenosylmethionine-diacylgycerolhomoserine-N-methlytransferase
VTLGAADDRARMDRMYRHQRRIYDLTRRYYLLGRKGLIDGLRPPAGGSILEVGCGTASNLIAAAKLYPTARLYGFDISSEMLATAAKSVARRGLDDRVKLTEGDATAFDGQALFGEPAFDRIITSYTLSMIPNWQAALDEMARHLAPGGSIHIVDFGDCAGLPRLAKTTLYGWLANFGVSPRLELHAIAGQVGTRAGLNVGYQALFGGYAQMATLKRI